MGAHQVQNDHLEHQVCDFLRLRVGLQLVLRRLEIGDPLLLACAPLHKHRVLLDLRLLT